MAEITVDQISTHTLEAIRGKTIRVLDHGWVKLIDWMGSDEEIIHAARQSYGEGTKRVRQDRHLLRYLMRGVRGRKHTSPFEQAILKVQVQMPMDVARQWIRHRTASLNEYSTRYSTALEEVRMPAPDDWRKQSTKNKQGSEGGFDSLQGANLTLEESRFLQLAREHYDWKIEQGVAREQARSSLPLATYTKMVWCLDLHNLLHFLFLRLDDHAQLEIRLFAEVLAALVKKWCPHTWEAFVDYTLEAQQFSRMEWIAVKKMLLVAAKTLGGGEEELMTFAEDAITFAKEDLGKREWSEFRDKIRQVFADPEDDPEQPC